MASIEGVATQKDINTAMKMGTNYPQGPLEWAEKVGLEKVQRLLATLNETVSDDRFAAPPFGAVSAN